MDDELDWVPVQKPSGYSALDVFAWALCCGVTGFYLGAIFAVTQLG